MGRPGPRQRAENRACGSANSVTGRALRAFVNRVVEDKRISGQDVKELRRDILGGGFICREEADMLLALDRVVTPADGSWAEFLVSAIVEFAVWTSRPTGYIDADTARWLVATLSAGHGPTENAARIAFEVVKEAEKADEALLAFAMRGAKNRTRRNEREPGRERRGLTPTRAARTGPARLPERWRVR